MPAFLDNPRGVSDDEPEQPPKQPEDTFAQRISQITVGQWIMRSLVGTWIFLLAVILGIWVGGFPKAGAAFAVVLFVGVGVFALIGTIKVVIFQK